MNNENFKDYNLSEDILKALDTMGYLTPTEVQREVIPAALNQQDLIVKSQTGSGKTAAFAIPICQRIDWNENKPQALILTPTRELAVQVAEDITNIGRFKRIKTTAIYGKEPFSQQRAELKQKSHVVVGTPGRVFDHIERGSLPLECLECLVIDEADHMLNMGFIEQVEKILKSLPTDRITMLFSATLPDDIQKLCHRYMNQPIHIEIEASGITTATIAHSYIEVKDSDKFDLLRDVTIFENPDSCIIFAKTKEMVDQVHARLIDLGYPAAKIHGGMMQNERFAVMNAFKRGELRYLVATDVAARGIDIVEVSLVLNYDFPVERESYVHRTGRTGRAGVAGKAISFITPYEAKLLTETQAYIGFEIPRTQGPTEQEITLHQQAFDRTINNQPDLKIDKGEQLNKGITKLYFNGGKKKKIRALDFVGTLTNIEGVTAEDIGIIAIQDNVSYVDILNGKGPLVLREMRNTTVKGKLLKVHIANK